MSGLLLVVSGPSGVGKSTVCRYLVNSLPEVEVSVSMTTRPPREGEKEGINYYFVSEGDFKSRIKTGFFLEWAKIYGNFYGTPLDKVEKRLQQGKDVILEIDVQGALQVRNKYPSAVLVFVAPPSFEELTRRIVGRGTEKEKLVEERLEVARDELKAYQSYDYMVINDDLETSAGKIKSILTAEKCRVYRHHQWWEEKFGGR